MKPFTLDSSMTTMSGVFYPTGHVVVMLPGRDTVDKAVHALQEAGMSGDDISLLSPEIIHGQIARTVGNADMPLPSAGTEADTVRRFAELASQGHWGLMVHAPGGRESDKVMDALRGMPVAYAQRYGKLVIEDLA
ncbi:hypothetical protein [Ramlibacter tataouinensis]|uniref:Uncharacterized protein n=1 Tax=Ramlibacter tataouinensis (strain ATCC BAA-407 / DSM 14655 / LMG 21543 / TTB310) TaxID=365046 RepID=F5XWE8_RAMTT|nr:hypothetical protein [Ramlibacter tataouinensis]AEG92902.1 hypothetical protein Rta_18120 [Ramlibacter tataouinensis TTB310]